MARTRDYKAEYERRVASAAKRGLSRSQARGHARASEAPIKPRRVHPHPTKENPLERALVEYRRTGNRANAAKELGISPERFRRFLLQNVEVQGRGRSLKIVDNRNRVMPVITSGKVRELRLRDFDQASVNGQHRAAVAKFIRSNDRSLLEPFEGRSVIDAKGKSHPFETDPNALHRIAAMGSEVFHEIYRLVPQGG